MSPARSGIVGEVISKITPNLKKKKKICTKLFKIFAPNPKTKNNISN